MKNKRLVYIANARLPTEKAHGYQICKMCEAFAQNDIEVVLMHPYRHQTDPGLRGRSVFDYFSIGQVFLVRELTNWDVVRLERLFPKGTFSAVFFAHALAWGLYAALEARKLRAGIYYTRESGVAYWLTRLGLPTVYEAHVVPKRGQRWLLQRVACHPALRLVTALTSFIKKRFVEMGFPEEKVVVLPDGVDLSLFEDLPGQEECRRRLGLPLEHTIIGYIGRFRTMEMEKGIPELVQAMAALSAVNSLEPMFLCVGGPMEAVPAYLDLARRLGVSEHRLKFVDRVPNRDVPIWIRAADVVTIPWPWTEFSAYFTSPLKLFEYMASGVPIVATDLPAIREILRHDETAWLVEPGNPRALSVGISRVLSDSVLRARISENALTAAKGYSWNQRALTILCCLAKDGKH